VRVKLGPGNTVKGNGGAELPAKLVSPLYAAVMVSVPAARAVVLRVAVPLEGATGLAPSELPLL